MIPFSRVSLELGATKTYVTNEYLSLCSLLLWGQAFQ